MTVQKILRDPVWQFIGAFLTLVGLGIAGYALYHQLYDPNFGLQAVILTNTSLVSVAQDYSDEIEVSFKGQPADNLSLVDVKIENTGNQPIRTVDFEAPINFVFPQDSIVADASVVGSAPRDFSPSLRIDSPNVVSVNPQLFNGGDRAIFRFIVKNIPKTSSLPPFEVHARIANISQVELVNVIDVVTEPGFPFGTILVLGGIQLSVAMLIVVMIRCVRRQPSVPPHP